MWNIKFIIRDLFKTKSFQEFINRRFKDETKVVLEKEYVDYVGMKNGDLFYVSNDLNTAIYVYQDYIFSDIRKDDIVIDIGANIGGFCIPASRMSDHVYAVEPITTEELRKNVSLNKRNIQVIDSALGDGSMVEIGWGCQRKSVKTMTLGEIKAVCGGCDFLKIDCEGGEWSIKLDELKNIRRIEMEVHKIGSPFSQMENMLSEAGFTLKVRRSYIALWLIHAVNQKINNS
jgi:hypothetical protein